MARSAAMPTQLADRRRRRPSASFLRGSRRDHRHRCERHLPRLLEPRPHRNQRPSGDRSPPQGLVPRTGVSATGRWPAAIEACFGGDFTRRSAPLVDGRTIPPGRAGYLRYVPAIEVGTGALAAGRSRGRPTGPDTRAARRRQRRLLLSNQGGWTGWVRSGKILVNDRGEERAIRRPQAPAITAASGKRRRLSRPSTRPGMRSDPSLLAVPQSIVAPRDGMEPLAKASRPR